MTSIKIDIPRRRRAYVRLIGKIQHVLNEALGEERKLRKLTRAEVARILGKDKAFVTRKLTGEENMTLETLSDLAFAMDRTIDIKLLPKNWPSQSNYPPSVSTGADFGEPNSEKRHDAETTLIFTT
jgi:transcriptional regulator with XRE-family HTH domain